MLTVTVSDETYNKIEEYKKIKAITRSELVETLLNIGLEEFKIRDTIKGVDVDEEVYY